MFTKCERKEHYVGDNMASMEIEKTKAYQDAYNLGKNISQKNNFYINKKLAITISVRVLIQMEQLSKIFTTFYFLTI